MPKGDFEAVVAELRPYISPNHLSPNCRALNAEKKVAITKGIASIGMIANSFGVAIYTVSVVFAEVCEAISKYMGPKFISLQKYEDEMGVKAGEFEAKLGVKQAFGCIGGTHIPIKYPV